MQLPIFQVDAFAEQLFGGNPAAVCPLESWLDDELLQSIAAENNLAETAFFTLGAKGYEIRWFTPTVEVALCGHATLAAAAVLFDHLGFSGDAIEFQSKSGVLSVKRCEQGLQLNFPTQPFQAIAAPASLAAALGAEPLQVLAGEDLIAVLATQTQVQQLTPDLALIKQQPYRGVIVTAAADADSPLDFVCRVFAPQSGIDEDSVTGSAYTKLAPYWAEQLQKTQLQARQLSKRGGNVHCQIQGERVLISGAVAHYLQGVIQIPNRQEPSIT